MARVKRGVQARRRHKKVLKAAKGYYGARSRSFRVAKQAVIRAGQYAYRDRRQRKRQFRSLWIVRINAAAREHGLSYSRFMHGLAKADIEMDRRVLADLAVHEKEAFGALAERAKAALAGPRAFPAPPAAATGVARMRRRADSGPVDEFRSVEAILREVGANECKNSMLCSNEPRRPSPPAVTRRRSRRSASRCWARRVRSPRY